MAFTAADVMRLREETDAPMMECKAALTEAGGDFEKAKQVLREKGKAAAAKRSDRSTAAGVVAIAEGPDFTNAGGVVLECETDFVARNEGFIAVAEQLAQLFMNTDPGTDPMSVSNGEKTVKDIVEEAVALFRENIKLTKAVRVVTSGNQFASYVHHDRMKGVIMEVSGSGEAAREAGRAVAVQAVAFPPVFVSRDQVPQDFIAREIEVETQRAVNEGKPENIARNIAQGRVNKEIMKRDVLLEQPFYKDLNISVGDYLKQASNGSALGIVSFTRLAVGESA